MKFYTLRTVGDNEIPVKGKLTPCITIDFKSIFIEAEDPIKALKPVIEEYALSNDAIPIYLKNIFTASKETSWVQYPYPELGFLHDFNIQWGMHNFMVVLMEMKAMHIRPRLCITDIQNPFLYENLGRENVINLHKNDYVMPHLYDKIQRMSPDIWNTNNQQDLFAAIENWDQTFHSFFKRRIAKAIDDSYIHVFGKVLPWSNLGDISYKIGRCMAVGEFLYKKFATRCGNVNTPMLFIHPNRPKFTTSVDAAQASVNHLIDFYRAVKEPKIPVISPPGFILNNTLERNNISEKYWKFLVEYLIDSGCKEVIYV